MGGEIVITVKSVIAITLNELELLVNNAISPKKSPTSKTPTLTLSPSLFVPDKLAFPSKIINKYPAHKNLDYVYYMRAMCYYEQITHHGLDGTYNELAYDNFKQVINRFPESKYASDSRQKIILVNSNKAAKHMEIGRFYLKEKK